MAKANEDERSLPPEAPSFQRLARVFVGDAIDDRTGEIQVVLILEAMAETDQLDRYRFCLPPEEGLRLGRLLLSGETTLGTTQTDS